MSEPIEAPQLFFSESAANIGINAPVIAVVTGVSALPVDQTPLNAAIDASAEQLPHWIMAARRKPEAAGFSKLFSRLGYTEQRGAFERLADATLTKGFKRVNAIVDAYNLACLSMGSPIGCHDLTAVPTDILIDRAGSDVRILPLFQSKTRPVPEGDLIYRSGCDVMCWMGRKDIDSDVFAVKPDTTSVVIMAIGNEDATGEYNRAVCQEAVKWLSLAFPNAKSRIVPGRLAARAAA